MHLLARLTLPQMLTLPYIALVLLLTGSIGALSYNAGQQAVDTLSDLLLTETVNRITQAVDRHVAGSAAVLETAFPKGVAAPPTVAQGMDALRTRFWLATSVHRDPNNYAYYGDIDGHFFGLWRHGQDDAELRLRLAGSGPRSILRFSGMHGALGEAVVEQRIFEPRERPWFKVAHSSALHAWTSIYIDFKTAELVATRARRVGDAAGEFRGVVATDLSLQRVNEFLRGLPLSANGLAFVVERDGNLIGVSRGAHLKRQADGGNARLNAAEHENPLVRETYKAYQALLERHSGQLPRTDVFDGPDGQPVQVAHARMRDNAGLDWVILVAVPRSDFLHRVSDNFRTTMLLAGGAALAVLAIGLGVLGVVSRDLAGLARVARRFGEGHAELPQAIGRRDEIGELARSFVTMQRRLMTDPLTGLANREAVTRRLDERLQQCRRSGDVRPFAVLFVDLNRFKQINDRHGHEVGDQVLQELARRLREAVRPGDDVARYAGDEFLVVLDSVADRADAERLRALVDARLREPLQTLAGRDTEPAGAAVGLALYPDDARRADSLIRRADEDMYRRK
ncbi:diguanylate cyclase [Ideonella sp. DXS22W]|uniref:Diguanylate cyclase n=1 Tax=Pseudaquabacterium inlustre TaxID=2984192 RepID=A0ABU9CIP4_9BURK